jgi:uncharacterized protein (DUF1330 family)
MSDRPAYLLLLASVTERRRFADYVAEVSPQFTRNGARLLALAPAHSIEAFGHDDGPAAVMVSRWRDIECLRNFWHSPEHRRLADQRARCGELVAVALDSPVREPSPSAADAVLALFLGTGPSPALLEAEGARLLALLREPQVELLQGDWRRGDIAIYGWASAHSARRQLLTFCSGQRGRALLVPAVPLPREAPIPALADAPLFVGSFAA